MPLRVRDRLLMQPATQRVLHHFGNELEDKKWVFILGCYNSGTTLLAELLQTHERLDGLPNEGAFLSDALPYPERFGWPRMWFKCSDEMAVPANDDARARRIRRQWSLWLRGNPDFVVEKSIANVLRIEFLMNNFDDVTFVHIVRNGYAVAAGIQKKANLVRWRNPEGLKRYPIELCASQWSESVRRVHEASKDGAPILEIAYEDLTIDPIGTLKPVFKYLRVDPLRDASVWGKMDIHGVQSDIQNMNASSIRGLSEKDIAIIRRVAGPELASYGYQV